MEQMLYGLTMLAALGTGLMAGLFFAFSTFVMTALGRLTSANGIAAMNAINTAILHPLFFVVFFGTAAASLLLAFMALSAWSEPGTAWLLTGGLLYLIGNTLVTLVFNVPLNNTLARAPDSAEADRVWAHYLAVWTSWNHVRTIACLAATAAFIAALR